MSSSASKKAVTVVVAAATASAIASAYYFFYYLKQGDHHETAETNNSTTTPDYIDSPNRDSVDKSLWKSFEEAAHAVKNVRHLQNGDKLILYGLYKQTVVGDAPGRLSNTLTAFNMMAEQAKFAAWNDLRGMEPTVALKHYVAAVKEFSNESPTEEMSDTSDDYGVGAGFASVSRPVDLQDTYVSDGSLESKLLESAGDAEALRTLLSNKDINVRYTDPSGQTALHMAADTGTLECVKLLVSAGCDINAADRDGISVLQAAVIAGHEKTVEYLVSNGADPDQADIDGDTPRSCADKKLKRFF